MVRRFSSSNLRVEALEDRSNPSTLDPSAGALTDHPRVEWEAVPFYLKLQGVDGNKSGNVREDAIDLLGQDPNATQAGGGGAGKVSMRDFSFTMKVARAVGGAGLDVLIANTGGDRDAGLDDNQHGTHVAGTVAATPNNAVDYRYPDLYLNVWINQTDVEGGLSNDVVFGGLGQDDSVGAGAGKVQMQDFHFIAKSSAGDLDQAAARWEQIIVGDVPDATEAGTQIPIKIKHNL